MLKIENLEVRHGSNWDLRVSIDIPNDRWTSIVGPSGSGKSTFLMTLAGFIKPQVGRIYRDGVPLENLAPHKRAFGYVFQSNNLFDHLTVMDNLLLALSHSSDSKSVKVSQIKENLLPLDIPLSYLNKPPSALSGGERARIAIARAIIVGHSWLLLDEAFGSLDRSLRLQIQVWIEKTLRSRKVSILSVTHQTEDALLFSDQIIALSKGRVAFHGDRNDIDRLRTDLRSIPHADRMQFRSILGDMSQIEWPNGDLTVATESDVLLTEPEYKLGEWKRVPLANPVLLYNPPGWILRDKGTQTILKLDFKPQFMPQAIWAKHSITNESDSHPK